MTLRSFYILTSEHAVTRASSSQDCSQERITVDGVEGVSVSTVKMRHSNKIYLVYH